MKERIMILVIAVCMSIIVAPAAQGKAKTIGGENASANRASFVGEVVKVDLRTRIMTLRGRGSLINFDVSNVVLKGYVSLTEIKKGQVVAVRYSRDAIQVERSTASAASAQNAQTSSKQKSTKKLQIARRVKADALSFSEIDNNKDGYISPIELCVAIPDLTMDQFRQYDKNHDGRLDKAEFAQIKLR